MPLPPPPLLDIRSYEELRDEAIARIPLHNQEWTNFNASDPGITLIELFAFLTEGLLYRANQIPDRNRRHFLSLLGVPLAPAASAQGLITFANERGPLDTLTLGAGVEVRAGRVPFHTRTAVDVLPVEARALFKREVVGPAPELVRAYRELYASYRARRPRAKELRLYETVPLGPDGVDLAETADGSLWIALLMRSGDDDLPAARKAVGGRVLSVGLVPRGSEPERTLRPAAGVPRAPGTQLEFQVPQVEGPLPREPEQRIPRYRTLEASTQVDVLEEPGIVDVALPEAAALGVWDDLEPLEAGVGEFPPALEDPETTARVITWLRIRAPIGVRAQLLWAGIDAAWIAQRTEVAGEVLADGTGEPDQVVTLANAPVIPDSVRLTVGGMPWQRIEDLLEAGPEVPVTDPRRAPGAAEPHATESHVYAVDPGSGELRFGDGIHGARPPAGAPLRADYAYGSGRAGNVADGAVNTAPALPAGFKVTNPVRTWGGAEGETVAEGERQVARYLQHRDRAVTAEDFEAIVKRAPGADIGRVEVLAAFSPALAPSPGGDAAGVVTLLLVPRFDADHPDAPEPGPAFLEAVCRYLEPRRLVTTEVVLRGPVYKGVWISVGLEAEDPLAFPTVREAVKARLREVLSPVGDDRWPLGKPVSALELHSEAARVAGVRLIRAVLLAGPDGAPGDVPMTGLELPRIAGLSVTSGDPLALDRLQGTEPEPPPGERPVVPVPVVPETC
jgi:hypothetical protein